MAEIDLLQILSTEKKFRQDQVFRAWFDAKVDSYEKITTLPKELREKLKDKPWLSLRLHVMHESKKDNTKKALLKLSDDRLIEAVLMGRKNLTAAGGRDRYTICISSQVGCGMKCAFCATGKAGFSRNLTPEEVVDQYRFWQRFLAERNLGEIDNMVIMGQGEPLLNYENIKTALNIILKYTTLGPSKITLSTCGIPVMMDKLAVDKDFPPVRFALSLHSAIEETRAAIMPSHQKGFLEYLVGWAKKYHQMHPSRAHFIGLEYIMLGKVNDGPKDLKALMTLASKLGKIKINLIPYNNISTVAMPSDFDESPKENIEHWHTSLMNAGFTSTVRYSQGQDIAAACGQLRNAEEIRQSLVIK
ncbi:MAG TPA: 23S rRNA (adenine(2503)-C(2))-methyltransferase RlmN [Candidatus Udaeobacter sp.]|nr:23S rRNA (adenine(2503)-C(2))-methyltransferase RlmN [Candidatus Udaeobacter sp.]